ncbi:MAG: MerR family transcriptional regulator [Oscillospiraceae bacterium]|jgi:DNA-binding transcriptional MerR regulator|nr:MerR family transcriptional regulator [Oscillospiraceae bacterium]
MLNNNPNPDNSRPYESYPQPDILIPGKKFAELTKFNQSTLKYYDEIGLLYPAARDANGWRYYAPEQLVAASFIRVMINWGIPLKEIIARYRNATPADAVDALLRSQRELDEEIEQLRERFALLHTYTKLIDVGITANENVIAVEDMTRLGLIMGAENVFTELSEYYKPFHQFLNDTPHLNPAFPIGSFFTNFAEFKSRPAEPSNFFAVDPKGLSERPAGSYLVGYSRGFYGQIGDLPDRLRSYAAVNQLNITGPVYVIYLHDEVSVADSSQFLLQASVRISVNYEQWIA